jgi:homoserine kinase type II
MDESGRTNPILRELCGRWLGRDDVVVIEPLAPGFSGAAVYRVAVGGGLAWVLKSLHDRADADRIAWVHGLMRHLRSAGIAEVPIVATAADGRSTWQDASGGLWEIVEFVAGVPLANPSLSQAAAAARVLARLHVAASTYPAARPGRAAAPAIVRRIEHARRLLASPWTGQAFSPRPAATPFERAIAERLTAATARFQAADGSRVIAGLAAMRPPSMHVQAVLRDVSSDHVLFDGMSPDRVAGIIDFHAAGIDTPMTDLARLVGSWEPAASETVRLVHARDAYEQIRPLEDVERSLMPVVAASGTVFGLDNWFRWVLVESREFALPAQVVARVDRLVAALPAALADLAVVASPAV